MARIVQQQQNIWGSQGATTEPQRADLWFLDFREVISGLNNQITAASGFDRLAATLEPYHAISVQLPPLIVKSEEYKRDSRPYKMPAWDEAVGEVKVVFYYDSPFTTASKVYKMLDTWRAFIRAGRRAMGNEQSIDLNDHYRIDYAFNITLTLLRGNSNPTLSVGALTSLSGSTLIGPIIGPSLNATNAALSSVGVGEVQNDLEQTAVYLLENCWLSSFRITDLDYSRGTELAKVEATFLAENLLNEPIAA